QNDSHDARVVAGGSGEHYGVVFETVQTKSDGFKTIDGNDYNTTAGYDFDDVMIKARLNTGSATPVYQALEVKYGRTEQDAQQSYLGLTDEDYAADPFRLYAATQIDQLDAEFTLRQVSWLIEPGSRPGKASLTFYDNAFERSWYRVTTVDDIGLSAIVADPVTYADQLSWLKGTTSPHAALRTRDNPRTYEPKDQQGRGEYDFMAGSSAVKLTAGFRLHEDFEDRFQKEDRYRMQDNNMVLTTAGAGGGQDNRVGDAKVSSGFVAADIDVGA